MKIIIILITFFLVFFNTQSKDLLIYADDGTWLDGIVAFEQFLESEGYSYQRIYANDFNNDTWNKNASAICFPGGYAHNYKVSLKTQSINQIRNFISNGGGYIGICAGAFFAAKDVAWEGGVYPYRLSLFNGVASGALSDFAPWPEYAMTEITINKNNPVTRKLKDKYTVLYFGGPDFEAYNDFQYDTIALWGSPYNSPAIINFNYDQGKVLLIGPHLEIETDSDRDSTLFASELDDVESDWEILSHTMKWLLNIKDQDTSTSIATYNLKNKFSVMPNPAINFVDVRISDIDNIDEIMIVSSIGEIIPIDNHPKTEYLRIDLSGLNIGVYTIIIKSGSELNSQRFTIMR